MTPEEYIAKYCADDSGNRCAQFRAMVAKRKETKPAPQYAPRVTPVHLPEGLRWDEDQYGNEGCGCKK